ncbi:MAG: antitoxin family protein [Gemmataceae bacterium]|nr:antitoxin family protein [Gemmataceae bacterium]
MTVRAIYENGVFRPTEPVALPDRCEVEFEPKRVPPPVEEPPTPDEMPVTDPRHPRYAHIDPDMRPIYAILAHRFDDGGPVRSARDTHNDHQP